MGSFDTWWGLMQSWRRTAGTPLDVPREIDAAIFCSGCGEPFGPGRERVGLVCVSCAHHRINLQTRGPAPHCPIDRCPWHNTEAG